MHCGCHASLTAVLCLCRNNHLCAGFEELARQIEYVIPLQEQPFARAAFTRAAGLDALSDLVLRHAPEGVAVSWWAEEAGTGLTASSPDSTKPYPVASAIKTFLLVALYYEHKDEWDGAPPELESILAQKEGWESVLAMWDPSMPEWQAYKTPPGTLDTVKSTLRGWTYRMIAQGMMGTTSMGVIGNPAYNTCANVSV
eukprot:SAG31_NODE_3759_length_3909_cov_2.636220_2_plen_198_part_00